MAHAVLQTLLRVVYPPRCLSCGDGVDSDFGLCGPCWRDTPFVAGLACDACGLPLPGESDRGELCDDCLSVPRPWDQGRAALVYRDTARRLVLALKHGDRHDIARPASDWMARLTRPIVSEGMIVVPVPLHLRRLLKRRYNQSALLGHALAGRLGIDWSPDALLRPRATPSLDGKTKEERFALLDGRITVNPRRASLIAGRPVLIVDDVMTSGATLAAATKACHAAGATRVCVAVLARVGKDA
ncbi:ComF family protein [Citreimonas salinaria]|uniref:Predicted amidophosphoribosyltransferases n=1 Tax=Citreimonas salinaria TaxID=321339 RepID=A0A1H3FAU2_9RHOB|nr:double zinc ribbon domain-containing protein [Citreimonas salinaria]SDX88116.1 Predicted amidophosphoribosyltransferases [Citreimonas salinaria]